MELETMTDGGSVGRSGGREVGRLGVVGRERFPAAVDVVSSGVVTAIACVAVDLERIKFR